MRTTRSTRTAPARGGRLRGLRRRPSVVAVAVLTGLVGSGAFVWQSTQAAFTSATNTGSNSWSTGTVTLNDDSGGSALFTATNLVPTSTYAYKCLAVTYSGNVASTVKIFASANTDATPQLAQYINITIDDGGTGGFSGCSGSWTNRWTGKLNTLNGYTSWATGILPWSVSSNTTKVYRIGYALDTATPSSAAGKSTSTTITWEADSN